MSDYQLQTELIEINLSNPKEGLKQLLSIDSDFSKNEVYWRPDTQILGFTSEADRISTEITKSLGNDYYDQDDEGRIQFLMDLALNCTTTGFKEYEGEEPEDGASRFILGNDSYCSQYEYISEIVEDYDYKIFLAWMTY